MVFATGPQNLTLNSIVYPENATATFDISATSIAVHLLNLTINPFSVNQAIGSVQFTITGAVPTNPTIGSNSDTTFGIIPGGVVKNPITAQITTNWTTSALGQQVALCVVCASGGTTGLIVGGPNPSSDKYDAADTTLATNTSGQWIIGSGDTYTSTQNFFNIDTSPAWVINFAAGVNLTNVVITNVIFGFGENAPFGTQFIDVPQETPEPGSVILFGTGLGLLAIAAGARRLRRR